jgi:WD40 repeat protein/serine/threonine protein kinase
MTQDDATQYKPAAAATNYYQQIEEKPLEELEAQVAKEWQVGDIIMDLYEVKEIITSGGMGLVYRVHHRGWNLDLAVKSPRPEIIANEKRKLDFIREAETWVNLGLHPHTVSCYYVRDLGGIPRAFAEFIEGGSLSDWIKDRRLYASSPKQALERILDIAIQVAWGLHYAHEQGLVHQDIKPANVMMTPDGVAKVTDFGLAKARAKLGETAISRECQNILVSSGGMTPAYCSPEQAAGQPLERKTDIWSWGVSVLEMFVGTVTWMAGQVAAEALESYLEVGQEDPDIPAMPLDVADLLRVCFQKDPPHRPEDMSALIVTLQEIYRQEFRQPYMREELQAIELRADSLNNKALSLMDLGQKDAAEVAWGTALQADPYHAETIYNQGLVQWRSGKKQDDMVLVSSLETAAAAQRGGWRAPYLLGQVHLERGDGEAAKTALQKAAQLAPEEEEVRQSLARLERVGSGRCLYSLEGHMGWVHAVAVTPDGRHAISGGTDKTLRVWDLASGRCLRTLEGHTGWVHAVAVTPDGYHAVSGSRDKTLRVWDLASGRCLRTLVGHTDDVRAVAVTPDGRHTVSGSWDKTLRVWDLASGRCLRTLEGRTFIVEAVAVTPDGRHAVSGSWDKTLRVWDLTSGRCLRTLEGHKNIVCTVAITLDGHLAISGGKDKTLKVWDLASGRCLRTLEGHTDNVEAVAVTPDGCHAVSGSRDKTLRVWDLASGRCLRTLEGHPSGVHAIAITPDGYHAVSGSSDFTLRVWDLRGIGDIMAELALSRPLNTLQTAQASFVVQREIDAARAALASGQMAEVGAMLRRARSQPGYERDPSLLDFWHQAGLRGGQRVGLVASRPLRTLEGHKNIVCTVAITPDGCHAVSGSWDKTLRVWDLASGRCLRTLEGHTYSVDAIAITPDSRHAVSGNTDYLLRVWDLASGRCLRRLKGHTGLVHAVAITPDGYHIVSGSKDKTLRVWDLASGRCLRTHKGHKKQKVVIAVAVTPDGRHTVTDGDRTLRVCNLASGRCLRRLKGHKSSVKAVAVTPDGHHTVSGSRDNTLRVWDLASGRCLHTLEGHTDPITAVAVTPNGRHAMSGSMDKTLRVWDLASGRCLRTLEGHTNKVGTIAITPDGRHAVSGSDDHTLRVWELNWEYEFPESADWDEAGRPYLENFLVLHTPYGSDGLSRAGTPNWTEDDFQQLLNELIYRGFGWLRPEGVRRKLEEMAAEWKGPRKL